MKSLEFLDVIDKQNLQIKRQYATKSQLLERQWCERTNAFMPWSWLPRNTWLYQTDLWSNPARLLCFRNKNLILYLYKIK